MKTVKGKPGKAVCCAAIVLVLAFASGCLRPGPKFNPYIPSTYNESTFSQVKLTNAVPKPELLKPSGAFFTLGPGDKLDLEIIGDPTTKAAQTTVGPDGKIYFHLLPGLDVWGLTLAETKALLEKELQRFIKDQPVVSVTLRNVESKKIWLLGRFTTPGVYTMNAPMTVLEAFAMAGGTMSMAAQREAAALTGQEIADLRRAFVMRKGERLPIDLHRLLTQGDLSQNIYLEPDDFIYVPTATMREITVLGAVAQPRSVPYMEGMGLIQAIAHANGTAPEAYQHHVAIVRGSLSEPRVGIIDYKDIAMGRAPDVPLEPGDIVYVPYGPYRYLVRYADLILRTFLNTVAINEGTRAASARQTSVVIPIGTSTPGTTLSPPPR